MLFEEFVDDELDGAPDVDAIERLAESIADHVRRERMRVFIDIDPGCDDAVTLGQSMELDAETFLPFGDQTLYRQRILQFLFIDQRQADRGQQRRRLGGSTGIALDTAEIKARKKSATVALDLRTFEAQHAQSVKIIGRVWCAAIAAFEQQIVSLVEHLFGAGVQLCLGVLPALLQQTQFSGRLRPSAGRSNAVAFHAHRDRHIVIVSQGHQRYRPGRDFFDWRRQVWTLEPSLMRDSFFYSESAG